MGFFSAKSFAAAMIAFYIALSIDLDRPYWCIGTVYIVSQPLAGAMRAKGIYRMCGTLVGAVAAIAMVPNLADAPVVLVAALCLWLGVCLYFSLCDRTPRSYVFMLAGYTAAIIGFPSVDQPDQIFTIALTRGRGDRPGHCLRNRDRLHRLSPVRWRRCWTPVWATISPPRVAGRSRRSPARVRRRPESRGRPWPPPPRNSTRSPPTSPTTPLGNMQ